MTELLEKIALLFEKDPDVEKGKKKPITIRCILLFDGTMNNKTNIQSRIDKDEFYKSTISTWSKVKYSVASTFSDTANKPKGDDSYENGFTNIVSLDTYMEKQPIPGYDITLKIYTEGAGTLNNESDATMGYAMGLGDAGVKNKCAKGILDAINQITEGKIEGKEIDKETQYIKKLTFDVFGFSRGAATARHCIYQLLINERQNVKRQLGLRGLFTSKVEVCFAGLFDTVSSHGISFSNDVRRLELDAVKHATKVIHLVAAEEYRQNFSITNIKSAGKKGKEFFFPGVHSDVGGSYLDNDSETFQLNSGNPTLIRKDKATLIEEGWYDPSEIEELIIYNDAGQAFNVRIRADRHGIRNTYCKIPLKFMAKYARSNQLKIKSKLEEEANELISEFTDLKKLDDNLSSYLSTTIDSFKISDPFLKRIRHDHLHMSSKDQFGLKPRFKNGKRWRQCYDG